MLGEYAREWPNSDRSALLSASRRSADFKRSVFSKAMPYCHFVLFADCQGAGWKEWAFPKAHRRFRNSNHSNTPFGSVGGDRAGTSFARGI